MQAGLKNGLYSAKNVLKYASCIFRQPVYRLS